LTVRAVAIVTAVLAFVVLALAFVVFAVFTVRAVFAAVLGVVGVGAAVAMRAVLFGFRCGLVARVIGLGRIRQGDCNDRGGENRNERLGQVTRAPMGKRNW
jgi:hypothetical protein